MKRFITLFAALSLLVSCQSTLSSAPSTTVTYAAITGSDPQAESLTGFTVTVNSVTYRAVVNRFTRAVTLYLPSGTAVTALTPAVSTASGLTVTAPSTAAVDFSSPVTYTLSDGSSYVVTVKTDVPSAATVNGWIGKGINVGNDLDAWPGAEGSWTNSVVAQETFFDDYKKLGFNSVRIPITWGEATNKADRLSDAGAASTINSTFMNRVDQVVGWAIDAGLTVVINAHHEDWIRTLTGSAVTAQMPRFEALWTQIAEHFKGWPPQLVFEILNEPQGKMTNADVITLNQAILKKIRPSNPTRVVIVGSNSYNSLYTLKDGSFSLPTDSAAGGPFLIANFHNYNPWTFAGQSSGSWGSSSDIASMKADLDAAAAWAAGKSVPVYMGEYGVTLQYQGTKTDLTSRTAWYTQVTKIAKADGISMALWDDYGDFKLYDRVNRTYDKNALDAVLAQ